MLSGRWKWLYVLALFLAVLAVYWPGLSGSYVFDDHSSIVNNPNISLFKGTLESLQDASTGNISGPLGRPFSMASFAANQFISGTNPRYFKLTNLLIHLANGLLVLLLIRQLWAKLVGADGRGELAAYFVTALWLLHPINLTPVLFVVQRMTSLSGFFTLAALNLYLYGRTLSGSRRWLTIGLGLIICWPAGILSKETALLLPFFILLIEWLALGSFRDLPAKWRLIGTAALPIFTLGTLYATWPLVEQTYLARAFTISERLLTETRVLWLYIGQTLTPWPDLFSLHHDDIIISRGLFDPPATALTTLAWAIVIGVAFRQRRKNPWLTFTVFWYLAAHMLESTILGLEIAYEHRNYLSSLGIFFGIAVLLLPVPSEKCLQVLRIGLATGFVIYCGLVTGLRAAQWGDEYIRTQIESNTHPKSARTHYEAARAILARQLPMGEISHSAYQMARIHFQRAAHFDPNSKAAPAGILYLDCAVGMPKDPEVERILLGRMSMKPFSFNEQGFIQGLSDMFVSGLYCLDENSVNALIAAALSNPTATAKIRGMLHAVAMDYAVARLGSLPRGRLHAIAAVESDPGNAVLRINLIRVLLQLGETDEAKQQYAALKRLKIPAANRKEVENLELGLGS